MFKTDYQTRYEDFHREHPDLPKKEDIYCLRLVMKREWAEKILSGEKKIEFRDFTDYYKNRLYDKDVLMYMQAHGIKDWEFVNPIRKVRKIHFQNYNGTWFLDVSVSYNDVMRITEEDVRFIQDKFGSHDCDEDLVECKGLPLKQRPTYFFFVVDKIISTNL